MRKNDEEQELFNLPYLLSFVECLIFVSIIILWTLVRFGVIDEQYMQSVCDLQYILIATGLVIGSLLCILLRKR
ncbi:MAG: hypothetical protein ACD_14C00031G0009 [uncultured bacterium]|nr:MAG: hypothetical protein ACD_14C00031G0009 [uncultured bacterium]